MTGLIQSQNEMPGIICASAGELQGRVPEEVEPAVDSRSVRPSSKDPHDVHIAARKLLRDGRHYLYSCMHAEGVLW